MAGAQFGCSETGAPGGARREVLHEHIGARDDARQQRLICRILDVEGERLLASVEPEEIGALPMRDAVVAAREITLGPLDLDDPRAGIGEAGSAERRRYCLFGCDPQHALQCAAKRLAHGGPPTPEIRPWGVDPAAFLSE